MYLIYPIEKPLLVWKAFAECCVYPLILKSGSSYMKPVSRTGQISRISRKRFLTFAGIGTAFGVWAYTETKRRQKKAKKEGRHVPYGPYEAIFKRPFDAAAGSLALVLLSPALAAAGMLVRIKLGSPVIFRQERPGRGGGVFQIYKFRTMTDQRCADGSLLPDEDRLTGFGRMLRSTSLDELPELFNIIRGDMSIVGPRPLLPESLPRYDERQKHRHDVRPGLTGLAQVSGRNGLSWEQKFEDDLEYVKKVTFLKDLSIMLKTIAIVLKREGISSSSSATMEIFMGNDEGNCSDNL